MLVVALWAMSMALLCESPFCAKRVAVWGGYYLLCDVKLMTVGEHESKYCKVPHHLPGTGSMQLTS